MGNKIILSHIIDVIIDLEKNGINITINEKTQTVFCTLCFIAGDNLSLNTILRFSKSFNSSHCCRICNVSKKGLRKQIKETVNIIRIVNNYEINAARIKKVAFLMLSLYIFMW